MGTLTNKLREVFQELKPQEEVFMDARIDERGGAEYVQENDAILRELLEFEYTIESARFKGRPDATSVVIEQPSNAKLRPDISERTMQNAAVFLKDLKDDLQEDWKTSLERNMTVFKRKFAIHQNRLKKGLSLVIQAENNRVIEQLIAGPHDRINNEVSKLHYKVIRLV